MNRLGGEATTASIQTHLSFQPSASCQPTIKIVSSSLEQAIFTIVEHIRFQAQALAVLNEITIVVALLHDGGQRTNDQALAAWFEDSQALNALIDGVPATHDEDCLERAIAEIEKRLDMERQKSDSALRSRNKQRCEEETGHATGDSET